MLSLKRKNQGAKLLHFCQGKYVGAKLLQKTLVFLLVISLNWAGLLGIGAALAYYLDNEDSGSNIFQAGTLDFSLDAPGDFSLNFSSGESADRNVIVINEGSLLFKYIIEGSEFFGSLCVTLNLEAKLDGETKYNGSLVEFVLDPPVEFSAPEDDWEFIFTFSGDAFEYNNTSCQFYLDFKAWQDNLEEYPEGFSDIERVYTHLTLREPKTIVLNEFLPNPICNECNRKGILGEWVEIYNNSSIPVDLAGWYIEDEGPEHTIVISESNTLGNSTIIGPKGSGSEWLVVFLNDCVLNNDGDTVILYHNSGSLVDSYTYSGPAPENKSYARYPDGTGPWYDPVPTPGGPNRLEPFSDSDLFAVGGSSGQEEIPENSIIETATPTLEEIVPVLESEPELEPILETTTPSDEPVIEMEPDENVGAKLPEELEPEMEIPESILETATPSDEPIIEFEPELEIPESIIETVTPPEEPEPEPESESESAQGIVKEEDMGDGQDEEPEPEPELNNNEQEENI